MHGSIRTIRISVRGGESVFEAAVQSTVRSEPRNIGAALVIGGGKLSKDKYLAVALQRNSRHTPVDAGKSIQKAAVQSSIRIEPRDPAATLAVHPGEFAPDERLAVGL